MSAPKVRLVHDDAGTFSRVERPEQIHVLHGDIARSVRAPGPLLLAEGARVMGDVAARGAVHLARGASVAGSLRAVGEVVLGAHARVWGDVRAEGRTLVQQGAVVTGTLDAAGDVHIWPGARVGRLVAGGDLHLRHPVVAPKALVRGRVFVERDA